MGRELQNEFSLSHSKAKTIKHCARQWYWQAYASWGGWNREATEEQRLAYALKCGKSLDALVGEHVHRAALDVVLAAAGGMPEPDRQHLGQDALRRLRETVSRAQAGDDSWKREPKRSPMLLEHFYGAPDLADRLQHAEEKLVRAFASLWSNAHLQKVCAALRDGTAELVSAEESQSFPVQLGDDSVKVWVVLDMAVRHRPTGKVVVLDWKTGRPSDSIDEAQIGLYALWLRDVHGIHPTGTSLVRVYLVDRQERARPATETDLVNAKAHLQEALDVAKPHLVAGDIQRNQPMPKEAFAQLPEGSRVCAWCDARRLCGRG